jgi:hypothetical protein
VAGIETRTAALLPNTKNTKGNSRTFAHKFINNPVQYTFLQSSKEKQQDAKLFFKRT